MTSTPFMQLYIADYMGDTQHLTTEQHGAYLLLLMTMWRHGGRLPNEASKLARIARVSLRRWHLIAPEVMPFFASEDGDLTQKRLSEEYQKATSISEKRSVSGKAGGEAKAERMRKNVAPFLTERCALADDENSDKPLKSKEQAVANATVLPEHSQIPDTRTKKETPTALSPPTDLYAFQGTTIRLTGKHLEQWRQAFPHISLESELYALDEWAGQQGGQWFHAVASALAKKERSARERINIRKTELEAGPPKKAVGDNRI